VIIFLAGRSGIGNYNILKTYIYYFSIIIREFSKAYLKCRMNHELMAEEDLSKLGLGDIDVEYVRPETPKISDKKYGIFPYIGWK